MHYSSSTGSDMAPAFLSIRKRRGHKVGVQESNYCFYQITTHHTPNYPWLSQSDIPGPHSLHHLF